MQRQSRNGVSRGGCARRATKRGQAVLETALISVVMLLLFAGAVDVGRMFYHYINVTNAAREGARTASRLPCDPALTASRTAVRNAIVASAVAEAGATGTPILAGQRHDHTRPGRHGLCGGRNTDPGDGGVRLYQHL